MSLIRFVALVIALGATALAAGCSVIGVLSGRMPDPVSSIVVGPAWEFDVVDPYAVPGFWAKAQLHVHTDRSIDGKWSVAEALAVYAGLGYDFVVLTDHDAVTVPGAAPAGLAAFPGEEHTLSHETYPLGRHAVFLFTRRRPSGGTIDAKFADVVSMGGLAVIAHPSWNGYGGNGEWHPWEIAAAPPFHLMEVYNPHSDPDRDTALWHAAALRRGPANPVWAVAVDDAHAASDANRGWTMVKVEGTDLAQLRAALLRGSHYATTGIIAEFGVDANGAIEARSSEAAEIAFINAANERVLALHNVLEGKYQPVGTEGFVRVEIRSLSGERRAWSQPFWLVEKP